MMELDCWKRLYECRDYIRQYSEKINMSEHPEEEIAKLYVYVKQIIPEFYVESPTSFMHPAYNFIKKDVLTCEEKLAERFIVDSAPVFDFFGDKSVNYLDDSQHILDYIVYHVRKYLVLKYSLRKDKPVDISRLDFENDCVAASNKVKKICDRLGLESYIVKIYPGYLPNSDLFAGDGFHMCNIVKIDGDEYYLVDSTYRQFFKMKQGILGRLGIVDLAGVRPGRFMLMNDERKAVADKLLKDGWIELNNTVFKDYLDGFTLSFRNGLYYEQTGDFSYTTEYSVDDYIRFLRGEDNQLNHESREVLGYQKRPLKNIN